MPLLQTLGNSGASAWGRLKRILGLYWVVQGTGSGYGVATTGALGNLYYQTYSTTIKLNKNGEVVWARKVNPSNTQALSIDSSENVYIAGSGAFFVAKYNSNGVIQWQRQLATNATASSAQASVTNTIGTTYICGQYNTGGNDYPVVSCVDSSGNLVWAQYLTTPSSYYNGIGYNATAGIAVAAGTYSGGAGVHVTAYAGGTGVVQWQRTITPTDGQSMFGMGCTMDSSGNVYVTGMSGATRHSFVVKYNSSGTFQWAKQLEIPGIYSYNDYATPGVDSAGNVYISFYQDYNNTDYPNYGGGFAKFTSNGTLQFIRKLNVIFGWLRLHVASDSTVAIMGTAAITKLKGDGSGLGSYSGFNYATSSLQVTTPSFNYNTAGFSYASPGFSSVASSHSVTNQAVSATVNYIGTEVG